MSNHITYCPRTGKEQFDTRSKAERVARGMKRRKHSKVVPTVYLCSDCRTYHITHYSYQKSRNIQQQKDE